MKLTKAIEIGDLNIKEAGKKMPPDCLDALKVLVEAGRAILRHQRGGRATQILTLPGETPE